MFSYTYDHELLTMTNQLLNSISDIFVSRFDVNKNIRDQIKVRVLYAPKERVLSDLLNRDQTLTLPAVSVQIAGVSRDPERVTNKLLGSYYNPRDKRKNYYEKTPLPVDVRYTISVMTRYQEDMDQIITSMIPYINPYLVVSWRTPRRTDQEIRSRVFWDGNVNVTYPVELTNSTAARVVADLSFTLKGWIFQVGPFESEPIYKIKTTFNSTPIIDEKFLLDSTKTPVRLPDSEQFIYSVPPTPKFVYPYFAKVLEPNKYTIIGSGFQKASNVYLSGNPVQSQSITYDLFSDIPKLSANNPPFFAVQLPLSSWSYDEDSSIVFNIPPLSCHGLLDIIIENPAGYGVFSGITVFTTDIIPPPLSGYILQENGTFYLLQENGSKINLNFAINNC